MLLGAGAVCRCTLQLGIQVLDEPVVVLSGNKGDRSSESNIVGDITVSSPY